MCSANLELLQADGMVCRDRSVPSILILALALSLTRMSRRLVIVNDTVSTFFTAIAHHRSRALSASLPHINISPAAVSHIFLYIRGELHSWWIQPQVKVLSQLHVVCTIVSDSRLGAKQSQGQQRVHTSTNDT